LLRVTFFFAGNHAHSLPGNHVHFFLFCRVPCTCFSLGTMFHFFAANHVSFSLLGFTYTFLMGIMCSFLLGGVLHFKAFAETVSMWFARILGKQEPIDRDHEHPQHACEIWVAVAFAPCWQNTHFIICTISLQDFPADSPPKDHVGVIHRLHCSVRLLLLDVFGNLHAALHAEPTNRFLGVGLELFVTRL